MRIKLIRTYRFHFRETQLIVKLVTMDIFLQTESRLALPLQEMNETWNLLPGLYLLNAHSVDSFPDLLVRITCSCF